MMQEAKISAVHRQRLAVVYVRQSSPTQLERNRESTLRQYNFVARAIALGWSEAQVLVIDEDQGVSANGLYDPPASPSLRRRSLWVASASSWG
jgi:hypothetical protein